MREFTRIDVDEETLGSGDNFHHMQAKNGATIHVVLAQPNRTEFLLRLEGKAYYAINAAEAMVIAQAEGYKVSLDELRKLKEEFLEVIDAGVNMCISEECE